MPDDAASSLENGRFTLEALDTSVPVLILGGRENSLSITRSLGKLGITVRVSGPDDCWGMSSRYCAERLPIPKNVTQSDFWSELLLATKPDRLMGSILIAGSDVALDFLARHHHELSESYTLGHMNPKLQLDLLHKRKTIDLAHAAGVDAPRYWNIDGTGSLEHLREQVTFPVMVKPIHSHKFIPIMGCKLFIVKESMDELVEKVRLCQQHGLEIMVVEMIPGPDSELSSYYTYLDHNHQAHFHYTKRVIRRYPENRGLACYHASEWLPETAEAGEAFFQNIGFTGLGNIEFKRDPRDNKLKVIEANARFTAAQELILRSGAPIDLIFYCVVTGQSAPTFTAYTENLTYWYGLRDFLAFLELHKAGKLTLRDWLASLSPGRSVSPLHDIHDVNPTLGAVKARIAKTLG